MLLSMCDGNETFKSNYCYNRWNPKKYTLHKGKFNCKFYFQEGK